MIYGVYTINCTHGSGALWFGYIISSYWQSHENYLPNISGLLYSVVTQGSDCPRMGKITTMPVSTLKTVNCHDANFVITGGTVGCRYDNLRCHQ